jgi:hypothetical protein
MPKNVQSRQNNFKNNYMKKLTDLVEKESLNLEELMKIKGAANGIDGLPQCDTITCSNVSKPLCTTVQCPSSQCSTSVCSSLMVVYK